MSKPSAGADEIVTSKSQLVNWFERKFTTPDKRYIGMEHEKPGAYPDGAPVPYENENGRYGIGEFLGRLAKSGKWEPAFENGKIIALSNKETPEGISLEGAGQIETGGAPLSNVHQISDETDRNIAELTQMTAKLGFRMAAVGYHPTHTWQQLPNMPKQRYSVLDAYTDRKNSPRGHAMIRNTSTVQANLGFPDEATMVKMLRVSLNLQPVVTAMFATSPFAEGQDSGYQSFRSHSNHGIMGGRYGFMLPVAFEEGFGFERFTDFALKEIDMMGVYQGKTFIDAQDGTFDEFMQGKLKAAPGKLPTIADWADHLNTIYPEVRLRQFLEMRGADTAPPEMIKGLGAFWAGILYDPQALDEAYEMTKDWTNADREYLRETAPLKGLQTKFKGGPLQAFALKAVNIAEGGLQRRNILNDKGEDETKYLKPLRYIAETGRNWALRLRDEFRSAWKGDVRKVFDRMDYEKAPSIMDPEPAAPVERKVVLVHGLG